MRQYTQTTERTDVESLTNVTHDAVRVYIEQHQGCASVAQTDGNVPIQARFTF